MPSTLGYSLADVLAVARIHPFYVASIEYPPNAQTIHAAREQAANASSEVDLRTQPLLWKKDLYTTIERLVNDTSLRNYYRQNVYASITGGGFGSKPLFFGTDVHENRKQRANFGQFLQITGLIAPGDWVLTVHTAGELYRSLDLTLEILENAGASVLSAGNHMPHADIIRILIDYHANVLSGDSSQILGIVHYISLLAPEKRARLRISKIIYTSESLTTAQKAHIFEVLGPISVCSIMGSAEAGPYAVSNPSITGTDPYTGHEDFIFDTRTTLLEVFPHSFSVHGSNPDPIPEGEQGIIAQTSLTRLRNPLVRYITGDVGSLHPLPEQARALIPKAQWPHLRILKFQGRDRRFSFEWDGEYIEFHGLTTLMNDTECGILQWQVILDKMEPSLEARLEIRLLCMPRNGKVLSEPALVDRITTFLHVYPGNSHRFQLIFVDNLDAFDRSSTGRKIIKFVDRFSKAGVMNGGTESMDRNRSCN